MKLIDNIDKLISEKLTAFENEQKPELLQAALDNIEKVEQETPMSDEMAQTRQISRWLLFFETLDRHIDSRWDQKKVPTTGVIPPASGGVAYFSDVNPSAIDDPAVRARYEKALKSSKDYAEWYRVQHELRRMNERATRIVGNLLTNKYAALPVIQQKLIDALTSAPRRELRKEWLQTLIPKQK